MKIRLKSVFGKVVSSLKKVLRETRFFQILKRCRKIASHKTTIMKDYFFAIPHWKNRYLSFRILLENSHKVTYRGITCRKFPTDYLLIQIVVNRVKPDLIIEIGTNHGGSALYLADLVSSYNSQAKIHTIDIVDLVTEDIILNDPRISRFLGGFENYDLSNCTNYKTVMVIDDGSHDSADVVSSLQKFKEIVTLGSYFIIEDGALSYMGWDRHYSGGPLKAIREFLQSDESFEVDEELTKFFGSSTTNNPEGYLRKVR
jgi:cephalosporin hydroxylase